MDERKIAQTAIARTRELEQQLLQAVTVQVDFADKIVVMLCNAIHTLTQQASAGNAVARQHLQLLVNNLKEAQVVASGIVLPNGTPPAGSAVPGNGHDGAA